MSDRQHQQKCDLPLKESGTYRNEVVLVVEVEGRCQGCVRAFSGTFIATPSSSSRMYIVNDELFVRGATTRETQRAFSIPVPTSSCSSEPTLSQVQQVVVLLFSIQSGMKPQWSQKCLQDNQWHYTSAAQVFTMLKMKGTIPEEAFKQISLKKPSDVIFVFIPIVLFSVFSSLRPFP